MAAIIGLGLAAAISAHGDVISYGPATFIPQQPGMPYQNSGSSLVTVGASGEGAVLIAPVQLPQGAKITKVTLECIDRSTQNVSLFVTRASATAIIPIAALNSTGSSNSVQTIASGVLTEVVNHNTNVYYLELSLPARTTGETIFAKAVVTFDPPPPALAACAGDVNGDRRVDTNDLSVLLARFGTVCGP